MKNIKNILQTNTYVTVNLRYLEKGIKLNSETLLQIVERDPSTLLLSLAFLYHSGGGEPLANRS